MLYCFPRSSIKFQGHTEQNITDFDPNWAFPDYRPVAAFKSLRFALLWKLWWQRWLQMIPSRDIHNLSCLDWLWITLQMQSFRQAAPNMIKTFILLLVCTPIRRHITCSITDQLMTCCLFVRKPFSTPLLLIHRLGMYENYNGIWIKIHRFQFQKYIKIFARCWPINANLNESRKKWSKLYIFSPKFNPQNADAIFHMQNIR